MSGLAGLRPQKSFNDDVTMTEDPWEYDEVPIPEYEKGEEPKNFEKKTKKLPFRVENNYNSNNNFANYNESESYDNINNNDNNSASLTFDSKGGIINDETTDLNHIRVTFPKYPCNKSACSKYVENIGGCHSICKEMFADDNYDSEVKFGVRRRSLHSFFTRYSKLFRHYLTPEGTPHKFMNCGCDCFWYQGSVPQRTYLAQYECWTCFGKNGKVMKNKENDELEEIGMTDFIDLNQKRGVIAHFLGPKVYEFHAIGVNRRM